MTQAVCIGIDWGSTHRRASLIDGVGRLLAQQRDDQGMLTCAGRFRASLETLLDAWPQAASLPVLMSGMVGAASGWQEVPYLDCALPLTELGRRLVPVRDCPPGRRWAIVPGYRWTDAAGRVDVMRGEETQLLGALQSLGIGAADGCYVLPGTHSKWVELRGGSIRSLRTYMSGELFALLRERGTLAQAMQAAPGDASPEPAAFARGVADAGDGALSHALFGARARVVTGVLAPQHAAGYVSGLLIGSEWHDALRRFAPGGPIRILCEAELAAYHAACAQQLGTTVEVLDAAAVQLAAWRALYAQGASA